MRTDVRTEVFAGITTFMTMAYIIFVNPGILSESGMPFGPVMVATCLSAAIGSVLMALLANYPVALAPGMGLNAFFTYAVCLSMKIPWQVALAAVFVEGVIFILLTLTRVREQVVNAIPTSLKIAISTGIGFFIAFIGFQNAGIIVNNDATLVGLASLKNNLPAILTLVGLFIMAAMEAHRIRGALLWGILIVTVAAVALGVAKVPDAIISLPPSLEPVFMKLDLSDFSVNFTDPKVVNFWIIVFTFFFVDFFDTIGTLVGVTSRAGLLDEKGRMKNSRGALLADAVATTVGAVLGTSTVTSYVESASGIEVGGRTGLTSIVTAALFCLAMFFSPIIGIVPACATAPALILVGVYMTAGILKMGMSDWTELVPAMITIFTMPFAYSIAVGIEFGFISYAIIKLLSGRGKEVSAIMWVLAVLFVCKELLM